MPTALQEAVDKLSEQEEALSKLYTDMCKNVPREIAEYMYGGKEDMRLWGVRKVTTENIEKIVLSAHALEYCTGIWRYMTKCGEIQNLRSSVLTILQNLNRPETQFAVHRCHHAKDKHAFDVMELDELYVDARCGLAISQMLHVLQTPHQFEYKYDGAVDQLDIFQNHKHNIFVGSTAELSEVGAPLCAFAHILL